MAENAENRLKFINCRHVVRVFTRSGPIADACKRRSPMFVLSALLNGMLMATGDGAKDCEMARASSWLPDRERSIIWRYIDGVSLALARRFERGSAPNEDNLS